MSSMESSTQIPLFEISCLAKGSLFFPFFFSPLCEQRHRQALQESRRRATPFARRCWSRAAVQPSTLELRPPRRRCCWPYHRRRASVSATSISPRRLRAVDVGLSFWPASWISPSWPPLSWVLLCGLLKEMKIGFPPLFLCVF
ncbi:hypothetical protein Scep_022708 [Stephania cephalantha]|uniref:Uncharacterized protein n=1 Tax=Stephania cephalantha TaxID=152367 RepID=A0AAP0FIM8_9MAGN